MADAPPPTAPADHARPRWVKIFVIVVVVITGVVIVAMVAGGGEHGPGRHLPGGSDNSSVHDGP